MSNFDKFTEACSAVDTLDWATLPKEVRKYFTFAFYLCKEKCPMAAIEEDMNIKIFTDYQPSTDVYDKITEEVLDVVHNIDNTYDNWVTEYSHIHFPIFDEE